MHVAHRCNPDLAPAERQAPGTDVKRAELAIAWAFLGAAFLLRIFHALRYPVNSDEPQHLHVVWGWVNGLLQYRDVFDNHTPLFHMLSAPVAAVVGERAELLLIMRLTMLPLCVVSFICVYVIGKSLFSRRVGVWAAVLAALMPPLFWRSIEFRADVLWMTCWLLAVAVLVRPGLTTRRSFLVGLLLGAAAGVSLKTTLLLAGLGVTAVVTVLMSAKRYPWGRRLRRLRSAAAATILGLLLIPTALIVFFCVIGAGGSLYYGTIGHNLVSSLYRFSLHDPVLSSVGVAIGVFFAVANVKSGPPDGLMVRRTFVFLLVPVLVAVLSVWPVRSKQTLIVMYPLLAVVLCAAAEKTYYWLVDRVKAPRRDAALWLIGVLVAVIQLGWLLAHAPWRDQTAVELRRWREVLRLTDPDQTVMDIKGELIFRPRAYYYVLEYVTRVRLKRGLLPDDVAERLKATRTCVASKEKRGIPQGSVTFIDDNYVPVGSLLAAGKFLHRLPETASCISFDVQIPARYAIVTPVGPARGTLDGRAYRGDRFLSAGPHEYRPVSGEVKLVLIWAQALERGFSPFRTSFPEPSQ